MSADEDHDIEVRLSALQTFIDKGVPTNLPLYAIGGLILIGAGILASFLATHRISNKLLITLESGIIAGTIIIGLIYLISNWLWKSRLISLLTSTLSRLEYIATELGRFVSAFDDRTRSHYHLLTQTKIRSYFILQAVQNHLFSEINVIKETIASKQSDLMLEATESILSPITVTDSPIRGNEITLMHAELETFLAELSSDLITQTEQTLADVEE